jgi:hypothetical protein
LARKKKSFHASGKTLAMCNKSLARRDKSFAIETKTLHAPQKLFAERAKAFEVAPPGPQPSSPPVKRDAHEKPSTANERQCTRMGGQGSWISSSRSADLQSAREARCPRKAKPGSAHP